MWFRSCHEPKQSADVSLPRDLPPRRSGRQSGRECAETGGVDEPHQLRSIRDEALHDIRTLVRLRHVGAIRNPALAERSDAIHHCLGRRIVAQIDDPQIPSARRQLERDGTTNPATAPGDERPPFSLARHVSRSGASDALLREQLR